MKKLLFLFLLFSLILASCAPAVTPAVTVPQATEPVEPSATAAGSVLEVENTPLPEPTAAESTATAVPEGDPSAGGTITRAITAEPPSLDPHGAAGASQNAILPFLLDTLVYRDLDNTYKPYLAERWEVSEDGLTVTFFLREGVTFHDGTPLNAEAVVYTFQRLMQDGSKSPMASSFANVEAIEAAAGENTVVFTLKRPSSSLLSTLSTAYAGIISPTAAEAAGEAFGMNPVGSGPFKMEAWQAGESITLVRNEAYAWAPPVVENPGAPYLERIVFQIIPDAAMQLTAFQAGDVDVLFVNQPSQLAKLKDDPTANVVETTLNSLIYLGFNVKVQPFDDLRVRRAIAHAINKEELLQLALGGLGEVAFSPLAPTLPGHDPELESYAPAFDLERSAALLQEAGYARRETGPWLGASDQPLTVEILTSTRPPNEAIATVLQEQLNRAGIPATIKALEGTAATELATSGEYQMMLWRYDWNDADVLNVYLSTARLGQTNRTFYSNPQLDMLLEEAAKEQDEETRNGLYSQAQKLLIEEQPWIPLYTPKDYIVMRSTMEGAVVGPMGRLLLNDVRLAE